MFIHSVPRLAYVAVASIATVIAFASFSRANDTLSVHEWGTFTAIQDEHGKALPGINIDDEPVPEFCHNLNPWLFHRAAAMPAIMMKGLPQRDPAVTLRLETPVLYFHPAAGQKLPFTIDVDVKFRAGWLTEFYPHAQPDAPGLTGDDRSGVITQNTVGSLAWRNVQVGTDGTGPETQENVWLAPREVQAAPVTVPPQIAKETGPEMERFLFYRGVANRPAPLNVSEDNASSEFQIRGQCADVFGPGQSARIAALWLVHVRADGTAAWRALDPLTVTNDTTSLLASTSSRFSAADYSASHFENLQQAMHAALVNDGLNPDEATAMLKTWRRAYFQSPGLRFFFLVPHAWTDGVLPLHLSLPADVHRVMMGRIELIGGEQRQLLKDLASSTQVSNPSWVGKIPSSPNAVRFFQGRSDFGDLGVPIPKDYQTYLDLGRFRNALVLAEERARPAPALKKFIDAYGLRATEPGEK